MVPPNSFRREEMEEVRLEVSNFPLVLFVEGRPEGITNTNLEKKQGLCSAETL